MPRPKTPKKNRQKNRLREQIPKLGTKFLKSLKPSALAEGFKLIFTGKIKSTFSLKSACKNFFTKMKDIIQIFYC